MKIKKIVIIEGGYVRDTQVYIGNPVTETDPNWESGMDNFVDMKYPQQYVGIIEGESEAEIRQTAADQVGADPSVFTLLDIEPEPQSQPTGKFYVLAGRCGVDFTGIYGSTDRNKMVKKMKELYDAACEEESSVGKGTFCVDDEAYINADPCDCHEWLIKEFDLFERTTVVSIVETKLGSGTNTHLHSFSSTEKAKEFLAEFIIGEGQIGRSIFALNGDFEEELTPIPKDIESVRGILENCDNEITIVDKDDSLTIHINMKETNVDEDGEPQ